MRQLCAIPARITPTLELSQLPSDIRRFIAVGHAAVLPYCESTTLSHVASRETEVRRMWGRVRRPREMDMVNLGTWDKVMLGRKIYFGQFQPYSTPKTLFCAECLQSR